VGHVAVNCLKTTAKNVQISGTPLCKWLWHDTL